jgi:hypothetical protein
VRTIVLDLVAESHCRLPEGRENGDRGIPEAQSLKSKVHHLHAYIYILAQGILQNHPQESLNFSPMIWDWQPHILTPLLLMIIY